MHNLRMENVQSVEIHTYLFTPDRYWRHQIFVNDKFFHGYEILATAKRIAKIIVDINNRAIKVKHIEHKSCRPIS